MADWYYIGHYGQLGPLTREQIDELVQDGVIARETFVWRAGMAAWLPAGSVDELAATFLHSAPMYHASSPPPPPSPGSVPPAASALPPSRPYGSDLYAAPDPRSLYPTTRSDRSRALAGVLQLLIPGVGRMYLGYAAYGVLQLVLTPCLVGWIWSVIDGLLILTGGVQVDGYGRRLSE